jgi:hypothetical protein
MNKPAGDTGGFVRFRVDLAYDGTNFAGFDLCDFDITVLIIPWTTRICGC